MKKIDYLKSLFRTDTDILGVTNFHPMKCSFYGYLKQSKMNKEDYEAFVKELYKEGLIKIDLYGYNSLDNAIVTATKAAVEYILKADKEQIGFRG